MNESFFPKRMKRFAKRSEPDENQGQIVAQYEELYCNVIDLSGVGFGCPDLAIACSGRMELVEVKTEVGQLNAAQKRFSDTWRGPKIVIVRTITDALNHVLNLRERVSRGRN